MICKHNTLFFAVWQRPREKFSARLAAPRQNGYNGSKIFPTKGGRLCRSFCLWMPVCGARSPAPVCSPNAFYRPTPLRIRTQRSFAATSCAIRSVGVRGADLVTDNYWEQIDLFSSVEKREKQMKMDSAVDEIRRRFGFYSIQRGLMYRDRILSAVNAKEEHTVHPHGYFG